MFTLRALRLRPLVALRASACPVLARSMALAPRPQTWTTSWGAARTRSSATSAARRVHLEAVHDGGADGADVLPLQLGGAPRSAVLRAVEGHAQGVLSTTAARRRTSSRTAPSIGRTFDLSQTPASTPPRLHSPAAPASDTRFRAFPFFPPLRRCQEPANPPKLRALLHRWLWAYTEQQLYNFPLSFTYSSLALHVSWSIMEEWDGESNTAGEPTQEPSRDAKVARATALPIVCREGSARGRKRNHAACNFSAVRPRINLRGARLVLRSSLLSGLSTNSFYPGAPPSSAVLRSLTASGPPYPSSRANSAPDTPSTRAPPHAAHAGTPANPRAVVPVQLSVRWQHQPARSLRLPPYLPSAGFNRAKAADTARTRTRAHDTSSAQFCFAVRCPSARANPLRFSRLTNSRPRTGGLRRTSAPTRRLYASAPALHGTLSALLGVSIESTEGLCTAGIPKGDRSQMLAGCITGGPNLKPSSHRIKGDTNCAKTARSPSGTRSASPAGEELKLYYMNMTTVKSTRAQNLTRSEMKWSSAEGVRVHFAAHQLEPVR
ncbi:hypothetical protein B0H17DRAFT_1127205 [Mycena rosella]|uniref:Uncharacterized protein n=1 Tax=Mycena rosella TaxID=1033263 RepID=A0AAD7E184_MYCRO|nr:hypothetical protein B0H17DRAFT_1127205 [Mycena rosella]